MKDTLYMLGICIYTRMGSFWDRWNRYEPIFNDYLRLTQYKVDDIPFPASEAHLFKLIESYRSAGALLKDGGVTTVRGDPMSLAKQAQDSVARYGPKIVFIAILKEEPEPY